MRVASQAWSTTQRSSSAQSKRYEASKKGSTRTLHLPQQDSLSEADQQDSLSEAASQPRATASVALTQAVEEHLEVVEELQDLEAVVELRECKADPAHAKAAIASMWTSSCRTSQS